MVCTTAPLTQVCLMLDLLLDARERWPVPGLPQRQEPPQAKQRVRVALGATHRLDKQPPATGHSHKRRRTAGVGRQRLDDRRWQPDTGQRSPDGVEARKATGRAQQEVNTRSEGQPSPAPPITSKGRCAPT